ncbi:cyclic pyranopterin monophosphate synthase MoaC [uncultured Campylobacter sp.]|uniref:cyclic pyranopterin monophosphate synthase MoaC n=1 Tax=uncultured Campylobacter sp. TaxID=218934 RepID=UPI002627F4B4|nr:cyclic pyranopterin monophosphate synthase MoaC [uncultured Campylobacter sp.]
MLTHLDEKNRPKMVDVSDKEITSREATASGFIKMSEEAFRAIKDNSVKKGPVLQTAVIAAIQGAKKTSSLIPMCHPLNLTSIKTDIVEHENAFELIVTVKVDGKTGVEMEALSGVSIGLLTIYDMVKAIDKSMIIYDIALLKKSGGKSGEYLRKQTSH